MITPYNLSGIEFNAADEESCGAFHVFNPDRPESTDKGPVGMVEEMRAFIRLTKPLRRLVDLGALFGVFSLVFTRHLDATAFAFEPSPWAYPLLVDHANANPLRRIITSASFMGDQSGRTVTCERVWKHIIANPRRALKADETSTQTETRLDDVPNIDFVDCIKIDVEGYECAVLRGASATIAKWKPIIFLECHCADLPFHGETSEGLSELIKSFGYRMEKYDGSIVENFNDCADSMTRVVCFPK